MTGNNMYQRITVAAMAALIMLVGCVPDIVRKDADTTVPPLYTGFRMDSTAANTSTYIRNTSPDTTNTGTVSWRTLYSDSNLVQLIDLALRRNQELNIVLQEIQIAQNEIQTRQGEFLPDVQVRAGAGIDKPGTYTRDGAVEESLEIAPGRTFPTPMSDMAIGADISWEVDIWKKLRNATEAARLRYLSTVEGTNFIVTNLVSEIAKSYYELMALDNILSALDTMIGVQERALAMVRQQKEAAQTTELAVRRFEAEVLKNKSRRYNILQRIAQTENSLNFLCGRYPQHVLRSSDSFLSKSPENVETGLPAHLLRNRPDVKSAELALQASDLDVEVAKARFYPTLKITAGAGFNAFSSAFMFATPESMIYNLAGGLALPVLNRNAIVAGYKTANAKQIQSAYNFERTILRAYVECSNQIAKISNMQLAFDLKQQQVQALTQSVDISASLFTNARADYMEVLLTQRDALEARMDLIETKIQQYQAFVDLYQGLGGGWR